MNIFQYNIYRTQSMLFLKKNVSEFHLAAIQPQYSSGDRRIRRRIKD